MVGEEGRCRIGEMIDAHRTERAERGLAPKTLEQDELYGYRLLRATGAEWVEELNPEDAYEALRQIQTTTWKPRTKNIAITRAKATLKWAVKRKRTPVNPWGEIDLFEEDECDRRALELEELEAIFAVSNSRWRLIWRSYVETLCRRDELRLRLWSDFDESAGVLKVHGRRRLRNGQRVTTKTKDSRECILGPRLVQNFMALRGLDGGEPDEPIFPSQMLHLKFADTSGFLSPGIPRLMLLRACVRAGVDSTGVDLHSLRVTGATLLAKLDVSIETIERMLGHGVVGKQHSLALRCYVKRRDPAIREAVEKLDELLFG